MNRNKDDNLINDKRDMNKIRLSMVLIKGLIIFLVINILFVVIGSKELGKLSLYNHLFAGRLRLPFGETPAEAYNFSLNNLDAMFASHVVSDNEQMAGEYRVFVIGDSSTWGILLKPEETLSGLLNADLIKCDDRLIKFYNLGYPTLSLTKDIMILHDAMQYKPDMIIWLVTLEAFPLDKQLSSPIVENNLDDIREISEKYNLQIRLTGQSDDNINFIAKSIFGQRRALADLIRLQLYGTMWAATMIDQVYPSDYERAQIDLSNDLDFHNIAESELKEEDLAFDVLDTAERISGGIPILLVNEPILVSNGENSDIRYNFYYPRWAYDQYRKLLSDYSKSHSWTYIDYWDIIPMNEFTNSAIHLTPLGERILANQLKQEIRNSVCNQ